MFRSYLTWYWTLSFIVSIYLLWQWGAWIYSLLLLFLYLFVRRLLMQKVSGVRINSYRIVSPLAGRITFVRDNIMGIEVKALHAKTISMPFSGEILALNDSGSIELRLALDETGTSLSCLFFKSFLCPMPSIVVRPGDFARAGVEIGHWKLGGDCELHIPENWHLTVREGQLLQSGETVVAERTRSV